MSNRVKAILGLASVFVLGGICGALIFGVVVRDRVRDAQQFRQRDGFVDYFERRLELTESQRDSLRDELEEAYQELAALRSSATDHYNAVIDTLKQRVLPQLSQEQRLLFAEQEEKLRRFMPREARPKLAANSMQPMQPRQPGPAQTSRDTAPLASARITAPAVADTKPRTAPQSLPRRDTATPPPPANNVPLPSEDPDDDAALLGVRESGARNDGEGSLVQLLRDLKLTSEQRGKLAAIRAEFRERLRDVRALDDRTEARRQFVALNRQRRQRSFEVLNAEQKAAVLEFLRERKKRNDASGR